MKINNNLTDIKLSVRTIVELASQKEGCIRADIGEPTLGTPKHIIEATKKALDEGKTTYASHHGLLPLREAIAKFESWKHAYTKDNVVVTQGAMHGLSLCMMGMLAPDDLIYLVKPCWAAYKTVVSTVHARYEMISMEDLLQKQPDAKAKAILFNSPNNPGGFMYDDTTLQQLAAYAKKHDLFLISDDVYDRIYYDEQPTSIMHYAPERTIVVNATSKTYAMTGFRVGWLCGPQEFIDALAKGVRATISCGNMFAQYGALAALTGPQDCVSSYLEEYRKRKDAMYERIQKIGWPCEKPHGAIYCYPNVGEDSWTFTMDLLEQANVAVVPGEPFGDKTHIRLSFGSLSVPEIHTCFDKIEQFLEKRKQEQN